jgi:hypothetical protein
MFPFSRCDLARAITVGFATILIVSVASGQERLPTPWQSPAGKVSQVIGLTDVTVSFGRPGVKGRTIWGDLVPYEEVWRAGANENTTISFQNDVKVEGKPLAAGIYGLHTIPHKDHWTVIFSHNSTSWGSFTYDAREDALRVETTPVAAPFREWLTYEFDDLAADHATLSLCWEKLAVPLHLTVDTNEVVLDNARNVYLRGIPGFTPDAWNAAARYCLNNKVNMEEGLTWAQRSVAMGPGFQNLWTQGGLLEALGRKDEGKAAKDKAMTLAAEADLNQLGYEYLQGGHIDDALTVFQRNVAAHPDSWNAYDSLAEACVAKGDKKQAIELYGKALAKAPDETQKARIRATLADLGG